MKTFSIMNQKGGVGKSTTAVNLAAVFASRGHRTLVLELDRQGNSSKVISGGLMGDDFPRTITDVFDKRSKVSLPEAVHQSAYDNLWYCPATGYLQTVLEDCQSRVRRESILANEMAKVRQEFDIAIIDCSPGLDLGTLNAMVASDFFLVPLDGHEFAVDGLSGLLSVLFELNEGDDPNIAVFRNEYDKKNTISNTAVEKGINEAVKYEVLAADDVLDIRVRKREVVGHASSHYKPLMHYRPKSEVNDDYQALADEVLVRLNVEQM